MRTLSVLAVIVALPVSGAAQPAATTPAQNELYTRARGAFAEGDYTEAIELLEAALRLGDVNILRLSLGRALFRDGRCEEARWEYERALQAPAVADPAAEQVAARVDAYREDLERNCPATLVLRCVPSDMRVRVADLPPTDCVRPLALRPGSYHVRGEGDGQIVERDVDLRAMEEVEVRLEVARPHRAEHARSRADTRRRLQRRRFWGVGIAGAGAAALLTASILDAIALENAIDDFHRKARLGSADLGSAKSRVDSLRASALTTYALGAALAGTGAVLLLTTRGLKQGRDTTTAFLPPAGGGVVWTHHY